MGTGFFGGFNNTRGGRQKYASGDAVYRSGIEDYFDNMKKRHDIDPKGKLDVVAHGSPLTIDYKHNGEDIPIDSRILASLLRRRKDYKKNQVIRLLSCETGVSPSVGNSIAQDLANKLGVIVEAPTDTYWATVKGEHFAAPRRTDNPDYPELNQKSELKKFYPGGNNK